MFIETLLRFTTYHFYHGRKYKIHQKGSSSAATLLVMTKGPPGVLGSRRTAIYFQGAGEHW